VNNRSGRSFAFLLGAFLALVALLQASLRFDSVRRLLNESIRLEGVPLAQQLEGIDEPAYPWLDWPPAGDPAPTGTLYVRLLGAAEDEVWVLVNGRAVKALAGDGGPVTVRDGEVVEVMSRGSVNVVVSWVSANLAAPAAGDHVRGEGALFLCRARLR
jgi:hypothetical protein